MPPFNLSAFFLKGGDLFRCSYLVGSPIGNLGDITLRALEVLKEVTIIAAEDTRRSSILLNRFEISKPLVSFHEHNEARRTSELLEKMRGRRQSCAPHRRRYAVYFGSRVSYRSRLR